MRKNVWIFNHYATNMYRDEGGRHYHLSKNLIERGYNPTIFCSSFMHKGTERYITDDEPYKIAEDKEVRFVFIKTSPYQGNGKDRIINMIQFFRGIQKNAKSISKRIGCPDVVIGSSVHPLACVAGIWAGKKFNCKVISEIRDLWPETLVMFGRLKEDGIFTRILYLGEKWIYKRSSNVIFTMEGGKQYILDKGWDKQINIDKVYYINNGVDLKTFYEQETNEKFTDKDLEKDCFKVIYTGAVSKANDIQRLVETAEFLQKDYGSGIVFLIYGQGEERSVLENLCKERNIENVIFKGNVAKQKIPYVLSKGDILLVNYGKVLFENKHNVLKYGGSHNKLFEYLAAGKPILYTQPSGYNLVEKYHCGIVLKESSSKESLAKGILDIYNLPECEKDIMCRNGKRAAAEFDFKNLSDILVKVIEA